MTDPTELRRLAEDATPGPWYLHTSDDTLVSSESGEIVQAQGEYMIEYASMEADAAYIAAANPAAILALLDRLARAETLVAQCKKTLIAMKPHEGWIEDSDVARLYIKTMEALGDEQ